MAVSTWGRVRHFSMPVLPQPPPFTTTMVGSATCRLAGRTTVTCATGSEVRIRASDPNETPRESEITVRREPIKVLN